MKKKAKRKCLYLTRIVIYAFGTYGILGNSVSAQLICLTLWVWQPIIVNWELAMLAAAKQTTKPNPLEGA